ncbi:sigma-70 family RNA polymerase sigma factor [Marinovum sp.]|uniref:sigma-70 family RNA polymerase sigma factor n=1 Tax=Marinovum sp. TaxID=2024839 RepID=UPI002B274782|nr:sigma-70 family RNA polymerase sigma factor [Marinovum sp.]
MAAQDLERLLTRVSLADRKAFAELYSATSAKLFGICLRILSDRAQAEDALQDVYVKIWNRADAYQPGRVQPMTWLITIARNHSIDLLRKRRTAATDNADGDETVIDRLESHAPGPAESLQQKDERARIAACLEELAEDKADAVRRAYLQGATYAELATHFAVPLNTMRTWLRRSLLSLRACLTR